MSSLQIFFVYRVSDTETNCDVLFVHMFLKNENIHKRDYNIVRKRYSRKKQSHGLYLR